MNPHQPSTIHFEKRNYVNVHDDLALSDLSKYKMMLILETNKKHQVEVVFPTISVHAVTSENQLAIHWKVAQNLAQTRAIYVLVEKQ